MLTAECDKVRRVDSAYSQHPLLDQAQRTLHLDNAQPYPTPTMARNSRDREMHEEYFDIVEDVKVAAAVEGTDSHNFSMTIIVVES